MLKYYKFKILLIKSQVAIKPIIQRRNIQSSMNDNIQMISD